MEKNKSSSFLNYKPTLINRESKLIINSYIYQNISDIFISNVEQEIYYSDLYYVKDLEKALPAASVYNLNEIKKSIGFGFFIKDTTEQISLYIKSLSVYVLNRFSNENIYIGSFGTNPAKSKFSIDKFDSEIDVYGLSQPKKQGIYIGIDEVCSGAETASETFWVFRSYIENYITIPKDVVSLDLYEYEDYPISYSLNGSIVTNGDFSFVSESNLFK